MPQGSQPQGFAHYGPHMCLTNSASCFMHSTTHLQRIGLEILKGQVSILINDTRSKVIVGMKIDCENPVLHYNLVQSDVCAACCGFH